MQVAARQDEGGDCTRPSYLPMSCWSVGMCTCQVLIICKCLLSVERSEDSQTLRGRFFAGSQPTITNYSLMKVSYTKGGIYADSCCTAEL